MNNYIVEKERKTIIKDACDVFVAAEEWQALRQQ